MCSIGRESESRVRWIKEGIKRRTLNILAAASKLCVTSNAELRRGAAEGAGERWGDVGSDDLLGRFFGRRFFTG